MTRPVLCIIHDLDGLRRWLSTGERRDRVVLTWSCQVYRDCEAGGIPCVDAIEMAGARAMDRVYETVIANAETWWSPQLDGLVHKGVHLGRCMGRDMLYAFLDAMGSHACITRALDELRPAALEVVDGGRRAFFWDPPGGPFPDFANATALWEAERRNTPAAAICPMPAWSPNPHRRNTPPGPLPGFEGREGPSLLFLLSGSDHAKLLPMLKPLFTGGRSTFLARAGDYPAPHAGAGQVAWYEWLSHFPPDPGLCARIATAVAALREPQGDFQRAHPYLFDNPHGAFQWSAFAHQLETGGRVADAALHLLSALRPDVCVLGTTTPGPWRCVVEAARTLGVPVASVLHSSILPDWLLCGIWRHEADALCIEGPMSRALFEHWGRAPESLAEIGFPQVSGVRRADPAADGPVLIIPNEWDWGFAVPAFLPGLRTRSFRELADMMRRMPDRQFVLKPHPKSLERHLEDYEHAARRAPNLTIADPAASLRELLATASAAILLDSCTQAFLDACLCGVPIISHAPAVLPARCNHAPTDDAGVPATRTAAELEAALGRLLFDPAHRAAVVAKGDAFMRSFSAAADIDAVRDNLVHHLDTLARAREEAS